MSGNDTRKLTARQRKSLQGVTGATRAARLANYATQAPKNRSNGNADRGRTARRTSTSRSRVDRGAVNHHRLHTTMATKRLGMPTPGEQRTVVVHDVCVQDGHIGSGAALSTSYVYLFLTCTDNTVPVWSLRFLSPGGYDLSAGIPSPYMAVVVSNQPHVNRGRVVSRRFSMSWGGNALKTNGILEGVYVPFTNIDDWQADPQGRFNAARHNGYFRRPLSRLGKFSLVSPIVDPVRAREMKVFDTSSTVTTIDDGEAPSHGMYVIRLSPGFSSEFPSVEDALGNLIIEADTVFEHIPVDTVTNYYAKVNSHATPAVASGFEAAMSTAWHDVEKLGDDVAQDGIVYGAVRALAAAAA